MAEYVTKEQVIDWYRPYGQTDEPIPFETLVSDLRDMKAADVAPVRHARWDDSGRYTFPGGGTAVRCTECGCALTVSEYHLNNWNYCPVCGSKMDGDKDA